MKPTQFREALQAHAVWVPFAFSVGLSVITVVTYVASGLSDAWIIPFVCFLPLTFFFASAEHKSTRERIRALEARIQQLETDKAPIA